MLYDPSIKENNSNKIKIKGKVFQRLKRIKESIYLKKDKK
jgi:hypothetical protein